VVRALGSLADDDPGRGAGLLQARGDGRHVPAAAERKRDDSGCGAELVDDLEDDGLLSLDAVRVDRVDEHESRTRAQLAAEAQCIVERPANLDKPRTDGLSLGALRSRGRACGCQDDRVEACARGVGRRGRRGVPRRGANDRARARLDSPADGNDHPAVLEAAGRVCALALQVKVEARRRGEAPRRDERRGAFSERDRGG